MPTLIKYILVIICAQLAVLSSGCAHKKVNTSVYRVNDAEVGIKSYIMSGNYLDLQQTKGSNKLFALNPGRIFSQSTSSYYVLNLVYISPSDSLIIGPQDELKIVFDQNLLNLRPYDVQFNDNETVAFFEINPYDIVDISNSTNVSVSLYGKGQAIEAGFSRENLLNFQIFSSKYILISDFNPRLSEPEPFDKWGFISPGTGSGIEFWIGNYPGLLINQKDGFQDCSSRTSRELCPGY